MTFEPSHFESLYLHLLLKYLNVMFKLTVRALMVTVSSMAFSKLDSTFGTAEGRCTVLGELSSLLVQAPRKVLSLER